MPLERIVLIGNTGKDVEMGVLPSGDDVANVSLAINKRYTNSKGEVIESTKWWRLAFFDKLAEIAEKYLHSGDEVYVEGEFAVDSETGEPKIWFDKNDEAHASLNLRVNRIVLLRNGKSFSDDGDDEDGANDRRSTRPSSRNRSAPPRSRGAHASAAPSRHSRPTAAEAGKEVAPVLRKQVAAAVSDDDW